ncbi:ribonuclease H-like domain-containing protein [Tanacetum coccineum]|uniref:Ribonuclease H-like domain-containing protein n=1 Tax=Tanacetum coccineum TaxID=301880 RepID=A0ABQ4XHR8_9ASTR
MRIEQYILMTDYALWEVILNGDSPLPTRTVDGVETAVPPTTAYQKLARKNELKAIEGLDQIYDRLQKLISQLETLCMDDLYKNLNIYEAKVMGSSSTSQNTQNVAFVSSNITSNTNEAVKTAHGVSAANSKANASTLPNVDNLSDDVIYSFFAKDGLDVADGNADNERKEISQEDRKESRAPKQQDNRNREITRRTVLIEETTSNALVSQCDRFGYDWSDQAEEGPTSFALMAYTSSSSSSSNTKVNDKYKTGEGYHAVPPPYIGKYMPPKPNVTSVPDIATSKAKTSESKPKSISEPLIEDWISDSEDENETGPKFKHRRSSFTKVEFVKSNEHVKSPRESVKKVENNKQAKYPRKNSQSPRGNQRNWNNLMTQKLGSNFEFKNKTCYVCGSFNHLIKDCDFYEKKMAEKPVWNNAKRGNPQLEFQEKKVINSGCSRYMIGNMSYLSDYEKIDGGYVAFGGDPKGEICDKKNNVLFTDTECVVLSSDFKLLDESQVLLRVPRKDNMYNVDLRNVVPQGGLTCLFAKATLDESNLWLRRLVHINFKTMNKLVRGNLTRATKDETNGILKDFIIGIENQINHRVKIIRCDNGTEFKNKEMNQFCEMKGIKREISVARTLQQNGVAE